MSELLWCEECKSRHANEFGDEFHGRVIAPIPDPICQTAGCSNVVESSENYCTDCLDANHA